jgi:hypothetical protein
MIHVWQRTVEGHPQIYVVDDSGLDMSVSGSSLDDPEWEPPTVPDGASEELLRTLGFVPASDAIAESARAMFRILSGEEAQPETTSPAQESPQGAKGTRKKRGQPEPLPSGWQRSAIPTVSVRVVPSLDEIRAEDGLLAAMTPEERQAWHDAKRQIHPKHVPCRLIGVHLDWYAKRALKFRSYLLVSAHPDLLQTGRNDLYETHDPFTSEALPEGQIVVRETEVAREDMQALYAESRGRGDETFADFGR